LGAAEFRWMFANLYAIAGTRERRRTTSPPSTPLTRRPRNLIGTLERRADPAAPSTARPYLGRGSGGSECPAVLCMLGCAIQDVRSSRLLAILDSLSDSKFVEVHSLTSEKVSKMIWLGMRHALLTRTQTQPHYIALAPIMAARPLAKRIQRRLLPPLAW
jgi:hypothetical protein